MNKTVLLASFIFPERLEWFLNYLETKFKINSTSVFGYETLDKSKLILTFKLTLNPDKRIDFKEHFPSAVHLHKRGECLYSINALNMLVDQTLGDNKGNVDRKSVNIDWSKHQGQMILTNKEELLFLPIKRVF